MTRDELVAALREENDFLDFEEVEPKRSNRRDLHAFLLLDELVPGNHCMVAAAEHDEIFLGVGLEELATVITVEQVQELRRCGIRESYDSLAMFA